MLKAPPSRGSGGLSYEERQRRLEELKAYEKSLLILSPEELEAEYERERANENVQARNRAAFEEKQRFFNQPPADADFEHWSKAVGWSLDEAIALSFGKNPEIVNWKSVEPHVRVSAFADQYRKTRDLAMRAVQWQQLYDPVLPSFFIAWAKRTDIPFPPELEERVAARGQQIADWKSLYDDANHKLDQCIARVTEFYKNLSDREQEVRDLKDEIAKLRESLSSFESQAIATNMAPKKIGTRERDTLLKLVIGMAVEGYKYDPLAGRNPAVSDITHDLEKQGVPLDVDTVRNWLKVAAELLPRQSDKE